MKVSNFPLILTAELLERNYKIITVIKGVYKSAKIETSRFSFLTEQVGSV